MQQAILHSGHQDGNTMRTNGLEAAAGDCWLCTHTEVTGTDWAFTFSPPDLSCIRIPAHAVWPTSLKGVQRVALVQQVVLTKGCLQIPLSLGQKLVGLPSAAAQDIFNSSK